MAIGDRIRRARLAVGLSQRELAAAVGVTHGIVGQWESHRKSPGRENVRKIAAVTLVDPGSLLQDVGTQSEAGVLVTDLRQIALLRRFALISTRQQENLLELLGVAKDVRRELEEKRHPAKARHPSPAATQ
ncbi:MAG TPA: helix-turn-helix domain-containing protein [Acetobacteraceae bacterium]|jgi:transcriptional regulator with XRE-family HTH domain